MYSKTRKKTGQEIIESLSVIDDQMFRQMAKHPRFVTEILREILGDPDLEVIETKPQEGILPYLKRTVILDCLCRTSEGNIVNVEIQKVDGRIDHQKRVRYHASMITVENTIPGTRFEDVPNVTVVYICGFDIFGLGKAMYEIVRVIAGTTEKRYIGFREIYLTPSEDSTDISELMKVFT